MCVLTIRKRKFCVPPTVIVVEGGGGKRRVGTSRGCYMAVELFG